MVGMVKIEAMNRLWSVRLYAEAGQVWDTEKQALLKGLEWLDVVKKAGEEDRAVIEARLQEIENE